MPGDALIRVACRRIGAEIGADPRYAHTSHLRVLRHGVPVFDEHYRGPVVADVFSVTKTVVATVAGIAARRGLLPGLDEPLHAVLPALGDTPARGQTWRHLLTMTRGAAVDGPWDIDAVTALPGGQVARVASAPALEPPGRTFRYDNGAAHLLSAGLARVLGQSVAGYAAAELFAPLGITGATGTLVAGDALRTTDGLAGPDPQYTEDAAQGAASVRKLAGLTVKTILPGHGAPLTEGAAEALSKLAASLKG